MDGIYAIANLCLGVDVHETPLMTMDDDWGHLPAPLDDKQFFCARLGDRLADFGPDYQLDWNHVVVEEEQDLMSIRRDRVQED